jgi:hypothetical protein
LGVSGIVHPLNVCTICRDARNNSWMSRSTPLNEVDSSRGREESSEQSSPSASHRKLDAELSPPLLGSIYSDEPTT